MLSSNVESLCTKVISAYSEYIQKTPNANKSMLLAEYSYPLISYWQYEDSEKAIVDSFDLLKLECDLNGRMGRLTKY